MATNKVKEILQYRHRDGTDYVLVGWMDGTSSWTRLSNLACKVLICEFISNCLRMLRQKQEIESVNSKRQLEAEMLRKIIDQNAGANRSTENAVSKEKVVYDIIQKTRERKVISNDHFPFIGIKQSIRPIPRDHLRPQVKQTAPCSQKKTIPAPSKAYRDITKPNICKIRYMSEVVCELSFYYKESEPVLTADIESMAFIQFEQISMYLYNLYRKQDGSLDVYCADASAQMPQFADFQKITEEKRLFSVFISDRTCWVLYFIKDRDRLLKLDYHNKYILLKIENDSYLLLFFGLKGIQLQSTAWIGSKYGAGVLFLSDYLFAGQGFPDKSPAFFIGDVNTCLGKHITTSIKKTTSLVTVPCDNCSIIVYESYFDYIHQIRGLESLFKKNSKFFGIQNFKIFEILKQGGIFTVTEEYVENCNCMQFFGFAVRLAEKNNWCIKITPAVYKCLKSKILSLQTDPEGMAVVKRAYGVLKSNCIDVEEVDFRRQLEKTFWRDYRYFLVIDDDAYPSNKTITLEEAHRLVGL